MGVHGLTAAACSAWFRRTVSRCDDGAVPGGILIAVILFVVFPVVAVMGFAAVAVGLGSLLTIDGAKRNEGSELLELNR
jgi:hypothetical protein